MDRRTPVERAVGRLARRDIWLVTDGENWVVEISEGGTDAGRTARWPFVHEHKAREYLHRCIETGGDGWTQLPVSGPRR